MVITFPFLFRKALHACSCGGTLSGTQYDHLPHAGFGSGYLEGPCALKLASSTVSICGKVISE